jgi:hypothetical protein
MCVERGCETGRPGGRRVNGVWFKPRAVQQRVVLVDPAGTRLRPAGAGQAV